MGTGQTGPSVYYARNQEQEPQIQSLVPTKPKLKTVLDVSKTVFGMTGKRGLLVLLLVGAERETAPELNSHLNLEMEKSAHHLLMRSKRATHKYVLSEF